MSYGRGPTCLSNGLEAPAKKGSEAFEDFFSSSRHLREFSKPALPENFDPPV